MKAIVQDRYGSPDVLQFKDIETPAPADGEVLIAARAASVNAYDWHILQGDPRIARYLTPAQFGGKGPKRQVRGRDVAGVVESVGRSVAKFKPGDEVYADLPTIDGAFAEYVCAPESMVERKPANLSFEQAAAMPLAGYTALKGLRDAGKVRNGQRVLINGASGGVGTFAIQIGKTLGAEVTAVCSTRNIELVRSLGADHVIDYTRADFTCDGQHYDVVFDLVGNHPLGELRHTLATDGTLILSGGGTHSSDGSFFGPMALFLRAQLVSKFARKQTITLLTTPPDSSYLADLRELAEAGQITPVIDRTYPLSAVPEAIRYVAEEHARSKVVITIS